MLKVEDLKNFNKYKNPPNSVVQTIVTDATPKMEEVGLSANNMISTKLNQVPDTIVQMVDASTQTETVTEDE